MNGDVYASSLTLDQVQEIVGRHLPRPPDGGFGWVVVFAAFCCNFIVDGFCNAFVEFKASYSDYFKASDSAVALIGSLAVGVYMLEGPIVSGLANKFGCRPVAMAGGMIAAVAFFLSVLSPNLGVFLFVYGVLGGVGMGCVYLPCVVSVSNYFESKRAVATGLAVSGSGVGTIVVPILARLCIDAFGWVYALHIFAASMLLCTVFASFFRPLPAPEEWNTNELENASIHSESVDGNSSPDAALHLEDAEQPVENIEQNEETQSPPTDAMARLRSALSECDDEDDIPTPTRFPPSPVFQKVLSKGRAGSWQCRGRRFIANSSNDVAQRERRDLEFGGRLSALTLARSLSRLSSKSSYNPSLAIKSINPKEFARPLNRRDVFYQGSLRYVQGFRDGGQNHYRESVISIPSAIVARSISNRGTVSAPLPSIMDEQIVGRGYSKCTCIPLPIRSTFSEMVDVELLKDPVMVVLCLSNLFSMLGFYVPYVFLKDLAIAGNVNPALAGYFISIMGVTNTIGRIFFGVLVDRGVTTALTLTNFSLVTCGLCTLLAPFMISTVGLIAYSLAFGFVISAYICMTSILLMDLMGLERLTNSFGLLVVSRGIASLIGTPLAGLIFDYSQSYAATFFFSGFMLAMAGILSINIPAVDRWRRSGLHNEGDDMKPITKLPPDNASGKLSVLTERSEEDLTDYQRTIQSLRQQAAILNELHEERMRLKRLAEATEHDGDSSLPTP